MRIYLDFLAHSLNLICFFCRRSVRAALALFAFISRAYHYDDNRLEDIEGWLQSEVGAKSLPELHEDFYAHFMKGFCGTTRGKPRSATINIHTFSHLYESRKRTGPLHTTSAEPFEAAYAVLRRCFKAGTPNTPKQILENFYLRDRYNTQLMRQ